MASSSSNEPRLSPPEQPSGSNIPSRNEHVSLPLLKSALQLNEADPLLTMVLSSFLTLLR